MNSKLFSGAHFMKFENSSSNLIRMMAKNLCGLSLFSYRVHVFYKNTCHHSKTKDTEEKDKEVKAERQMPTA